MLPDEPHIDDAAHSVIRVKLQIVTLMNQLTALTSDNDTVEFLLRQIQLILLGKRARLLETQLEKEANNQPQGEKS